MVMVTDRCDRCGRSQSVIEDSAVFGIVPVLIRRQQIFAYVGNADDLAIYPCSFDCWRFRSIQLLNNFPTSSRGHQSDTRFSGLGAQCSQPSER